MALARLLRLLRPARRVSKPPGMLVVGLGNKGREYERTRHNVGFDLVDRLAEEVRGAREHRTRHAVFVRGELGEGLDVALAKPMTYVNRSGEAVRELLDTLGLALTDCLVAVDDFNLELGVLRFRRNGSDGGHNGLKSIIDVAGRDFPRLRMGIGPLPPTRSVVDFVLGRFEPGEMARKERMVLAAVEAVGVYGSAGITAAMNKYNTRSVRGSVEEASRGL